MQHILLVTYTEKATGELRGRLRLTLEQELQRAAEPDRTVLQEALDQFDQMPIFTIHAFCQKILQDYAFDHRQDFKPQLVDDRTLLRSCLREIQRKHWLQEYGDELRTVLELSGYDREGAEAWEAMVLHLVQTVRPACGHRLLPEANADRLRVLPELDDRIRQARARLGKLAVPSTPGSRHPWLTGYRRLSDADSHQKRTSLVLRPMLEWLADGDADAGPCAAFHALLRRCRGCESFRKHGFRGLGGKVTGKADKLARIGGLPDAIAILEELRIAVDAAQLPSQLTVRAVHQLQDLLCAYKRQRGLMSFEDMLTRVDEGLDPARNPRADALVNILRQRVHYAIVDEFQDTDPVQWRILRRLFLEGGSGRLFLVGDPKQAIFNFRGADLYTYRAAVGEMTAQHGAQKTPLCVNWRSSADLLSGLNRLFAQGDWFGTSVEYRPVEAATDESKRSAVLHDPSGRAALTLVALGGKQTLKQAQRQFCRFAVAEIRRLLEQPATLRVRSERRLLRPGDIGLLVFRRVEAARLVKDLREAGIPCSLYKQSGLWQSAEALQVEALLKALARPDERQSLTRALLTRFVRVPAPELAQCEDLPPRHPARLLFDEWVDLAEGRKWAALFQSVLERSGVLHSDVLRSPEGERRLANYRHILGILQQAAYAQNLDLFGVLDLLHSRRTLRDGQESDFQPIETERDKVRILTIHASKGLEFPVVFLAGGFTAGRHETVTTYRDDDGRVIYNLQPDEDSKHRAAAERDAEQRRLLYVALTRAMVRLYVPWVTVESPKQSGPLLRIVAPALAQSQIEQLGPPVVERLDCPAGEKTVACITRAPSLPPSAEVPCIDDAAIVFPRLDGDLHKRRIVLRSFSSIHRMLMLRALEEASFADKPPRADDDVPEPATEYDPLRGPVFGEMVHNVLEKVDFAAVGRAPGPKALLGEEGPLHTLLEEQLGRHLLRLRSRTPAAALAQACREQIAGMVWTALHTPLAGLGGPLAEVPPDDRLHELEFHFPELWDEPPPAEVRREEGFLTGIIDLVVRRRDRFFLIDWKTNFLGGYTPDALADAMAECDYIRQYRLYLHALKRWLERLRGRAVDVTRDFGGVYYLFLRGLNGRDETSGVYVHQPTTDDLQLQRVLATQ